MTSSTSSGRQKFIRVKTARGRKVSSQRWLQRQLNDPYVQQAQKAGYRSRAAFKLLEIHKKYQIFKPGQFVIDLGAAPGGWCQAALPLIQDTHKQYSLLGLDLLPIENLEGVHFLQGDFLDFNVASQLKEALKGEGVDVVMSDMAANTIGHKSTDHLRTRALAEAAFYFAQNNLKSGGTFISKVFSGGTHQELLDDLKRHFISVKHFKPDASRKESPEVYVICQGFKQVLIL